MDEADSAGNQRRIDIGGDSTGVVVAGDYNVVIDAQHGSSVTLVMERERPRVVRRECVALLPRRQREPVGRAPVLAALTTAVQAGNSVQLWGPAGFGKSTVLRYAAGCFEQGPDGAVFVSAASREVGDLTQEIFEACYEAPGYAPSRTELRRLMTGVRIRIWSMTPTSTSTRCESSPTLSRGDVRNVLLPNACDVVLHRQMDPTSLIAAAAAAGAFDDPTPMQSNASDGALAVEGGEKRSHRHS
ncbi:P-loop NTPase family protein [Nocardia heshunensis]